MSKHRDSATADIHTNRDSYKHIDRKKSDDKELGS
jgi:hypothetical protein